MEVLLECPGDPGVGISPSFAAIQMEVWDEGKEMIREVLKEAFSEIWDHITVWVSFEGERLGKEIK